MDFSKFASVGETGRMLIPNEAGYPKLVQQEVPRNPLGNDLWNRLLTLRKATFFVAFPDSLTASNVRTHPRCCAT